MTTESQRATSTTERVQDLNERMLEAGRKAGQAYLDTAEKTFNGIADLQLKVADASQVEWISTVASAQAALTRELTQAYVSTGRELLAR
jgi:hypothetical protein